MHAEGAAPVGGAFGGREGRQKPLQLESGSSSAEHPASRCVSHDFAFRIFVIEALAVAVACATLLRFVRIAVHIVFRRLYLSTLTQFCVLGTKQLYVAPRAHGASDALFALTLRSFGASALSPGLP